MNLMGRLEKLEADAQRNNPRRPVQIVTYGVSYGDDVRAKQAEAEAEFRRLNPDWDGPIDGSDGPACIILRAFYGTDDNGNPKHPDWEPYLAAVDNPEIPENAAIIAAYESTHRANWQQEAAV